jgi:hypothetical protein
MLEFAQPQPHLLRIAKNIHQLQYALNVIKIITQMQQEAHALLVLDVTQLQLLVHSALLDTTSVQRAPALLLRTVYRVIQLLLLPALNARKDFI